MIYNGREIKMYSEEYWLVMRLKLTRNNIVAAINRIKIKGDKVPKWLSNLFYKADEACDDDTYK